MTLAAVKIDSQNMMPGTIVLFTGHVEDTLKRSLKIKTNHIALQKKMFARCAQEVKYVILIVKIPQRQIKSDIVYETSVSKMRDKK